MLIFFFGGLIMIKLGWFCVLFEWIVNWVELSEVNVMLFSFNFLVDLVVFVMVDVEILIFVSEMFGFFVCNVLI